MGYSCGLDEKTITLDVVNYRAGLPSNIEELYYVENNGIRLPLGYNSLESGLISNNYSNIPIQYNDILELNKLVELLKIQEDLYTDSPSQDLLDAIVETKSKINKAVKNCTISSKGGYSGDWFYLEGNSIKTSFESGTIKIRALLIPVCDRGFPYIIDSEKYLQAIEWYCIYNLLLQGYTHPTIKDWREAFQMWENLYPQALNNEAMPSIDDLDRHVLAWNSIKKDITRTTIDI